MCKMAATSVGLVSFRDWMHANLYLCACFRHPVVLAPPSRCVLVIFHSGLELWWWWGVHVALSTVGCGLTGADVRATCAPHCLQWLKQLYLDVPTYSGHLAYDLHRYSGVCSSCPPASNTSCLTSPVTVGALPLDKGHWHVTLTPPPRITRPDPAAHHAAQEWGVLYTWYCGGATCMRDIQLRATVCRPPAVAPGDPKASSTL